MRFKAYPLHEELVGVLRELYEWGERTGGWEDPVWRRLRQLLKRMENHRADYRSEDGQQERLTYGDGEPGEEARKVEADGGDFYRR